MKKIIKRTGKKADNRLRALCDGLSPEKRLVVVITALIVFAVMAVYMAVGSICFAQRPELNIRHIEGLDHKRVKNDSINRLNIKNHDDPDK